MGNTASLADERNTDNHRISGLAAEVMGGCSVTVRNTTLSGSITSASKSNANVGGLIAVSRGEDSNNAAKPSTIAVSKLSVKGETVTTSSDITSGGLLGYQWKNTNVKVCCECRSDHIGLDAKCMHCPVWWTCLSGNRILECNRKGQHRIYDRHR